MEARKKMLQESIVNRKKFLSSLPSHLKALKKASLPVQQQLGILYTKRMKQHNLAELLPTPLYILYTQVLAYKEAFDDNIELEIIGSAKDGQAIARQQALKDSGSSLYVLQIGTYAFLANVTLGILNLFLWKLTCLLCNCLRRVFVRITLCLIRFIF